MLTETITYFTRNGIPMVNTVKVNPAGKTVSESNQMEPGDTTITEQVYNQMMQDIETAKQVDAANNVALAQANEILRQQRIASATTKLLALGLTQGEIDVLTSNYPVT